MKRKNGISLAVFLGVSVSFILFGCTTIQKTTNLENFKAADVNGTYAYLIVEMTPNGFINETLVCKARFFNEKAKKEVEWDIFEGEKNYLISLDSGEYVIKSIDCPGVPTFSFIGQLPEFKVPQKGVALLGGLQIEVDKEKRHLTFRNRQPSRNKITRSLKILPKEIKKTLYSGYNGKLVNIKMIRSTPKNYRINVRSDSGKLGSFFENFDMNKCNDQEWKQNPFKAGKLSFLIGAENKTIKTVEGPTGRYLYSDDFLACVEKSIRKTKVREDYSQAILIEM